jgi:hypothetical protein
MKGKINDSYLYNHSVIGVSIQTLIENESIKRKILNKIDLFLSKNYDRIVNHVEKEKNETEYIFSVAEEMYQGEYIKTIYDEMNMDVIVFSYIFPYFLERDKYSTMTVKEMFSDIKRRLSEVLGFSVEDDMLEYYTISKNEEV